MTQVPIEQGSPLMSIGQVAEHFGVRVHQVDHAVRALDMTCHQRTGGPHDGTRLFNADQVGIIGDRLKRTAAARSRN